MILAVFVAELLKCYDACRNVATRDLVMVESFVKMNISGIVP